jgi:hypothetical protein
MYFESSAAWVLVSSPPMVWMTYCIGAWQGAENWSGRGRRETQSEKNEKTIHNFCSHIDAIFDELLGSYFKGSFALLDEASFYAVFDVGELSWIVMCMVRKMHRVGKDTWKHNRCGVDVTFILFIYLPR